ncbi:MAG: DinB family protein [Bacteroidota bacterium]
MISNKQISKEAISFLADIKHIILRDVGVLIDELDLIPEEKLWQTMPGITNSAGTLVVHLCGNLRHFIGDILAKDGYRRDRDREFSGEPIGKKELYHMVRVTLLALENAFDTLKPEMLELEMPGTPPHHKGRSIGFFLMQLSTHLSRHTGQLNYLRRILGADGTGS